MWEVIEGCKYNDRENVFKLGVEKKEIQYKKSKCYELVGVSNG